MEQKENIESNIRDLNIANEIFDKVKDYLLNGLTPLQLSILKSQENKETLKYKSFKNKALEAVPLSENYLSKFRRDLNNDYYFDVYSQSLSSIVFVRFSKKQNNGLASCSNTNNNLPILNLWFIDNDSNKFNLQTIHAFITHKLTVIHEMTHGIDGISSNWKIHGDKKGYYNQNTEMHAFIQEILAWIQDNFNSWNELEQNFGDFNSTTIEKFINYLLKDLEQRDDNKYYNEKDYYRFAIKNRFEKLSPKSKKKCYSKIAEYLQYNKNKNIKEAFEIPIEINYWE